MSKKVWTLVLHSLFFVQSGYQQEDLITVQTYSYTGYKLTSNLFQVLCIPSVINQPMIHYGLAKPLLLK